MTNQAALALPRAQWKDHPRYPDQVLLLGSHDGFRRTSQTLIDRAADGRDAAAIGWVFRYWKGGMHSHEGYEERKLYPYLEARWGLSCSALTGEHSKLHRLEDRVYQVLDQLEGPATHDLVAALTAHHEALLAHLDAEEALVIPALLALSPEEFETYYRGHIRDLLRDLNTQD